MDNIFGKKGRGGVGRELRKGEKKGGDIIFGIIGDGRVGEGRVVRFPSKSFLCWKDFFVKIVNVFFLPIPFSSFIQMREMQFLHFFPLSFPSFYSYPNIGLVNY